MWTAEVAWFSLWHPLQPIVCPGARPRTRWVSGVDEHLSTLMAETIFEPRCRQSRTFQCWAAPGICDTKATSMINAYTDYVHRTIQVGKFRLLISLFLQHGECTEAARSSPVKFWTLCSNTNSHVLLCYCMCEHYHSPPNEVSYNCIMCKKLHTYTHIRSFRYDLTFHLIVTIRELIILCYHVIRSWMSFNNITGAVWCFRWETSFFHTHT